MNNMLNLMQARLAVRGGDVQQDRMIKDKRETLDRVVLYSYQGAKVRDINSDIIARALINPNKVKQDYDDKIISIGYEYGYQPGTVFEWVNTGTKWLIYLQDLTELAYFKGDIRKCSYKIKYKAENGEVISTYAAIRGPVETKIDYIQKNGISLDNPNHSLSLLMPKTEENLKYFRRYSEFYLQDIAKGDVPICWRVEATDTISMPGILEVTAVEYYANETEDNIEEGIVEGNIQEIEVPVEETIEGEIFIKPKKTYVYKYLGDENASWVYDTRLPLEVNINGKELTLKWTTTYNGQFDLQYGDKVKTIVVETLF